MILEGCLYWRDCRRRLSSVALSSSVQVISHNFAALYHSRII